MIMNDPRLIKCEHCAKKGKNIYLGSLSSQGNLLIRNEYKFLKVQHETYTCILSESFTLIHDCGFTIKVESGIITQELASPILNG